MPLISLITPAYNRANFIGEMIQSIQRQTYQEWELVIVDDGSTDNTSDVVATFSDARIRYLRQANAGAAAARNAGIAAARGAYLVFIDSDDLMLPHGLEVLLKTLQANPDAGLAYGWFYFMDEAGAPLPYTFGQIEGVIPSQQDLPWPDNMPPLCGTSVEGRVLKLLLQEPECRFLMGSFLVHRRFVEAIGGFDPLFRQSQEDYEFFLRLARSGCTFVCARQAVMVCRDHTYGAHNDMAKMLAAGLRVLDQFFATSASDAAIAAEIEPMRKPAYQGVYLWTAVNFYEFDDFTAGTQSLNHALQLGPVSAGKMQDVISGLVRWLLAHPEADAQKSIQQAFAQVVPASVAHSAARQAQALLDFQLAFRACEHGQRREVISHALKAMMGDMRHVKNRGLAKITLQSLIG